MSEQPTSLPPTPAPPAPPRWWRFVGLRRRQGRYVHVLPNLWGWCLIVVVVGAIGMAGFAEYSMQPAFCNSCHIMEPYYRAWHESTHRDVPCVDCHFDPGLRNTLKGKWQASSQAVKYITQTYGSKPHAEVHDQACLREGCHERRLLEGKVNWTVKTQHGEPITIGFDHRPHLTEERRGKQLRCVSCHSQIVQGQHITVTLDTCFLCHMKGFSHGRNEETLGGCKSCHGAPKGQIRLSTGMFNHADYINRGVECINCHSDAISGDGAVPRQICWNCHNQPQQITRYGEPAFIHRTHISEHKVECSSCHIQIVHNLTAGASPGAAGGDRLTPAGANMLANNGACGQCHAQSHNGAAELYRGVGGKGVPDMPSPMSRTQVDCIACHRVPEKSGAVAAVAGQTFAAARVACVYCHGERYGPMLDDWKAALDAELQEARIAIERAQAALARTKLPGPDDLALRRLLDDAQHNLRLVQHGHGVHNVNYATALLSVAIDNSRQVTQKVSGVPASQPTTAR